MRIRFIEEDQQRASDEVEPDSNAGPMNQHLSSLCRSYAPLRKINRLAKLIALLNWYLDGDRQLPSLPAGVRPAVRNTPNRYPYSGVL